VYDKNQGDNGTHKPVVEVEIKNSRKLCQQPIDFSVLRATQKNETAHAAFGSCANMQGGSLNDSC
tara:strand:+ start:1324 stop:1518 length:195 start_codon:yes stop_codon:yes gene_type:complete